MRIEPTATLYTREVRSRKNALDLEPENILSYPVLEQEKILSYRVIEAKNKTWQKITRDRKRQATKPEIHEDFKEIRRLKTRGSNPKLYPHDFSIVDKNVVFSFTIELKILFPTSWKKTEKGHSDSERIFYPQAQLLEASKATTERLKSFLDTNREISPSSGTVAFAEDWINKLRTIVLQAQLWWREPLVNIGIDAEVVFEWWHNQKNLTVYILEDKPEFLKAWGTDMDNEMEEGSAKSSAELHLLWKWIAE